MKYTLLYPFIGHFKRRVPEKVREYVKLVIVDLNFSFKCCAFYDIYMMNSWGFCAAILQACRRYLKVDFLPCGVWVEVVIFMDDNYC